MDNKLVDAFVNGITSVKALVIAANTDTLVLPAARNRIAVKFVNFAGVAYFATKLMTAVQQGFPLGANAVLGFSQWFDGDLATNEWHIFTATAGANILAFEVLACPCATGHAAD